MPILKQEKLTFRPDQGVFDPSNFDQFKNEVTAGVYEDWKRDTVDEAKKRAVYQAPTYHQFEQLVAGCTLKPINKRDFQAPPKCLDHNKYGRQGGDPALKQTSSSSSASGADGNKQAGTSSKAKKLTRLSEFVTAWHRAKGTEAKVRLLATTIKVSESRKIFHKLEPDLLEDILQILMTMADEMAEKETTATSAGNGQEESKEGEVEVEVEPLLQVFEISKEFESTMRETEASRSHLSFCFSFLPTDFQEEVKKKLNWEK
ncbi:unnamed protein product [Amoebophrya sp. A120]|nr:unnamed protein product [Amoebophrya sp. A120]|eukprot:GSA120T00010178001.1